MNGSQKIDGVLGNQARLYGMSWKCPRSTESGFHAWSRPRRRWSLEYLPSDTQLLRRCASPRSMLYSVRHMSRSLSQASVGKYPARPRYDLSGQMTSSSKGPRTARPYGCGLRSIFRHPWPTRIYAQTVGRWLLHRCGPLESPGRSKA